MNNSVNLESICVMEMLTEDNIEIKEKLNLKIHYIYFCIIVVKNADTISF